MQLEWYWQLWLVVAAALPVFIIGYTMYRLRKQRYYVFLRLVDGDTGRPVARATVSGIKVTHTYSPSYASSVGGQAVYALQQHTQEKQKPLGRTDDDGIFRAVISYTSFAALWIEHTAPPLKGLVALEHVSGKGGFPARPFKCRVVFGMIQPPRGEIQE